MENKNYYEWLEVSPKASQEVIEKAYKALVIKYHPDLQQGNTKESEEIIKKINEAYDVLSNKEKRTQYDSQLIDSTVSKEDYDKLKEELNNIKQTSETVYTNNQYNNEYIDNKQDEIDYQNQLELARRKAYHDAYVQDLKNRGYKIRYKKSFKDYIKILITVIIILFILWLIWQIPFTRNFIIKLENDNPIIRIIVEILRSIFTSFIEMFKK